MGMLSGIPTNTQRLSCILIGCNFYRVAYIYNYRLTHSASELSLVNVYFVEVEDALLGILADPKGVQNPGEFEM